jgi:hypothetical protein
MRRALATLSGLALLFLAGCATSGGVEVAGRASQVSPPPPPPTLPSGTPVSADPIATLRADPLVSDKIKGELAPCYSGAYPIDDRYVDLTGDGKAELIVTLLGCAERDKLRPAAADAAGAGGYGYAGYVYDLATTPPTRLLGVEGGGVDLIPYTGEGNDLAVIRSRYEVRDEPCCPSDQTFVLYRWNGARLVEVETK